MEFCVVKDDKAVVERLSWLLRKVIGMEACASAFVLACYLKQEVGCTVYMVNPGKLSMIWQSTKKTDKEDALKLAKFIQWYPEKALSPVSLPTRREEELRRLIAMKQFLVKTRTALINRLYALYVMAGETGLKKNDLVRVAGREKVKGLLSGTICFRISRRYRNFRSLFNHRHKKEYIELVPATEVLEQPLAGGPFFFSPNRF
jgi:transposase